MQVARWLALAVVTLGTIVAAGHALGIERLERWDLQSQGMVPGTAVAFVLCGGALWMLATPIVRPRARWLAVASAGAVLGWAVLTGAEYLSRPAPRVDFVLGDPMREMAHPGRASSFAVIGIGLIAAALVTLDWSRERGGRISRGLTSVSALVVIFSATAWIGGVDAVRGTSASAGLPPQTALGLGLLVAGVLLARPDRAPVAWFVGSSAGAKLARRALPAAVGVPLVMAAAGFGANAIGWTDPAAGIALTTALTLAVLTVAVGVTGQRLGRVDEQRRLADAIVTGTHAAIVGVGADGAIVTWNAAAVSLFGYEADDVIGRSLIEILPALGPPESLARTLAGSGVTDVDVVARRRTGEPIDVSLAVSPLAGAGAGPVAASVIASDITERRRTERELEQQRQALREERDFTTAIVNSAGALVVVIDASGRIERFNAACERVSGYDAAEVVGRPLRELMAAPEDQDAARDKRDGEHERVWIARDGTRRLIQWSEARLRGTDGRLEHVVGVGIDVTERRRSERALAASDRQLRQLFEQAPIGIALVAPDERWVHVNSALCRLLGYTEEELRRLTVVDVTHPDDVEATHVALARLAREPGAVLRYRKRYVRADGESVSVQVSASLWFADDGEPGGIVAHIEDMTAREQAEERFQHLFEAAPIAMARLDLEARLVDVNPAFCRLVGRSAELLSGRPHDVVVHLDDAHAARGSLERLRDGAEPTVESEHRYRHASGGVIRVASTMTLLRDGAGRPIGATIQVLDVTERLEHERKLQHLADHDPLTGLLNRRSFNRELDRQLARTNRYGAEGALMLLDLDHFKHVNDTLGHGAGDQLIGSVARTLRDRLRESDVVARLGGDEFAVLLPHGDAEHVVKVAETIVEHIRDSTCVLDGQRYHVTASVGVALIGSETGQSAEDLLVDADLAMYEAKESGRDRFAVYEHGRVQSRARLTRIEQIRRAIRNDAFVLHAQPIYDLRDGTVSRYELLVRMRDDDGNTMLPASWLGIAERFDLVQPIDRWVTRIAIRLLAEHHGAGRDVALAVNLSGKSIGDVQLLALIREELARAPGVDPSKLIFEITETAAVQNIARARDFAEQAGALGCRFALDDFGAGFSSFYYLKHLPFDYIKIDGEFVKNCATSHIDQLVVESLVTIARGLGKQTIAEFVTNQQTLSYLRDIGVDYAQGHHIGAPRELVSAALAA